jgi:predicted nucleic acid-binding protein
MAIVIDTTVVIACVLNEPHRDALLAATANQDLIAPESLHWEVGNALSAMFKRHRIPLGEALEALRLYRRMQLELRDIDLESAVKLSNQLGIYAYDAYMIQCAVESSSPILTLDNGLIAAAQMAQVAICKVIP